MTTKFIFLLSITILLSFTFCSNRTQKNSDSPSTEITEISENEMVQKAISQDSSILNLPPDVIIDLLQGTWAPGINENATFTIKGQKLFYFEDPEPVSFFLTNDTMNLMIDGEYFQNVILKLDVDSLVFQQVEGDLYRLYNRSRK
jgi:hypothetical protein